jgi:cardiolipin synthase
MTPLILDPYHLGLQLLAGLHVALAGLVIIDLLHQHRTTAATIAWMMILLLIPYAGLALYFFVGAPRKHGTRLATYLRAHRYAPPAVVTGPGQATEALLCALGLPGATCSNRVQICHENEHAASELLRLIDSAQHRLYLSVFSLEGDAAGHRVIEHIAQRARAGVRVRILVDGFGSKELRSASIRTLRAHGAQVLRFRPLLRSLLRRGASNYRNHRKLLVVDGREAWLGGRNIANKYLASAADGSHWADLSLVIAGPAATICEAVFASDWTEASDLPGLTEVDETARSLTAGTSCVQVLPSGPDLEDDTLHATLLACFVNARQRIWIASPFFVPDDVLHAALRLACRRHVDVRVVSPRRSNKLFADWVRGGYLRDLQAAGGQVHLFNRSVLHAKAIVVDDHFALVGSANMDMRSLFTNHEIGAVLYNRDDVEAVAAAIEQFRLESTPGVAAATFASTVLSGALRIAAPFV